MRMIDLFPYLAYLFMGSLLLRAISHHWTAYSRFRRLPQLDVEDLRDTFTKLWPQGYSQWIKSLPTESQNHPVCKVLHWVVEKPYRADQLDRLEAKLEKELERVFGDLEVGIERNIATATTAGFFFTVLGLMLFVFSSQDNLSIQTLLQALGPALGTTALGGFIMMLEKRLQYGALLCYREHLTAIGHQLLEALHDTLKERVDAQRSQLQTVTRKNNEVRYAR